MAKWLEFLRGHSALTFLDVTFARVDTFVSLATVKTLQVPKAMRHTPPPTSLKFDCFVNHPSLCGIEFNNRPFIRVLPTLLCLCSFVYTSSHGGPLSNGLDALSSIPTLRHVNLSFHDSLVSRQLNFLQTLPQIHKLEIHNLPENFNFLERHFSLRELQLSEGDAMMMTELKSLARSRIWRLCNYFL